MCNVDRKYYLFIDIDGTIARNEQSPSPRTVETLQMLRTAGHRIFICSGRTLCDIYPAILDIGFDGIIAGAGAQIIVGGKEIYHQYLSESILKRTVKGMYANHFSGVLEGTGSIYYVPGEVELTGRWPRLRGLDELSATMRIEKFTIHTNDSEHIRRVLEKMPELSAWYDCYPNNSGSLCEFAWKGRNKAAAVDRVLDHYGGSLADTVAFGDSMNDYEILGHVAIGVAMGDSPLPLREIAGLVTGTLEEEGVSCAVSKLGII